MHAILDALHAILDALRAILDALQVIIDARQVIIDAMPAHRVTTHARPMTRRVIGRDVIPRRAAPEPC